MNCNKPEFERRVETTRVAGEVRLVVAVECDPQLRLVVVTNYHRQVEVRLVAVVEAAPEVVAV